MKTPLLLCSLPPGGSCLIALVPLCALAFGPTTAAGAQGAPHAQTTRAAKVGTHATTVLPLGGGVKPATKRSNTVVAPPPGYLLFKQATEATQAGRFDEAERIYRKLLKIDGRVPEAWANLGLLLEHKGDMTGAIAAFQKAVAFAPGAPAKPFWEQLAHVYARQGRWGECAGAAKRAIALDPKHSDDPTAYAGLAFLQLRRYSDALPYLRQRKMMRGETHPEVAEYRLIFALNGAGQAKEAETLTRKLVAAQPENSAAQMLLGDFADRRGDAPAAEAAYRRAFTIDTRNLRAGLNVAFAQERRGDRASSAETLLRLIDVFPDDPRLHFQLGQLYYSDPANKPEQFERAEKEYAIAAARAPKNAAFITQLGLSQMMQGRKRHDEATRYFNAALSLDKKSLLAQMGLAFIAEQSGKYDRAAELYRAALAAHNENDENTARARRRLAGVLYVTGKKAGAYREFDILADRFPDETGAGALAELASLQLSDKQFALAQKTYERLVTREPTRARAFVGLGQVAEQQKNLPEAEKQYGNAVRVEPKSGDAALILGRLLSEENKNKEAIGVYERLLAVSPADNRVRLQLISDYDKAGRTDDALAQADALILRRDDPSRTEYLLARPRLLVTHKRYAEAVTALSRLRLENPGVDVIGFELANAQELGGQADAADKTLLALEKEATSRADGNALAVRVARAGLYERTERPDEAATIYEDALKANPGQASALRGLARVRTKQGRANDAGAFVENIALAPTGTPDAAAIGAVRSLYAADPSPERWGAFTQKLATRYPTHAASLRARAAFLAGGDLKDSTRRGEAADEIRRLLTLNPNDSEAHALMGAVLEADGKPADAHKQYAEALRLDPRNPQALAALRRLDTPAAPGTPAAAAPTGGKGG